MAATAGGANDGYLMLWIDGDLKTPLVNIDNDTHLLDAVRLGPNSGLDTSTSGNYYFGAFESRRASYIGLDDLLVSFSASPTNGNAPLELTFSNTSWLTDTVTGYEWNFGDGTPVSSEVNPLRTFTASCTYAVILIAFSPSGLETRERPQLVLPHH